MNDVAKVLGDLTAALSPLKVRWYVFGAQAVVLYGRPRMTADLDVTLEVPPTGLPRLLATLAQAGLEQRVEDLEAFVSRTRVVPLVHRATGLPVDVVLAGPGLEMEFLERTRRMNLGGIEVPVISPEDLLMTKVLAGRPKDREDAVALLQEQRDHLDLARVRTDLSLLEEALDRSDLLPELERLSEEALVAKAGKTGGKKSPRGSRRRKH